MTLTERIRSWLTENPPGGKPPVVAIDGILGAGKSTAAGQILADMSKSGILLGTDAFILVSRHDWDREVAAGPIALDTWYDLAKLHDVLAQVKLRRRFTVEGLYNLGNGRRDLSVEIDAEHCDLVVIEGLFALHGGLKDVADVRVFLDAPEAVCVERARGRDTTVRNIPEERFQLKMSIYLEGYRRYAEKARRDADITYDNYQG